ncbi:hypothetical protein FCL54_14795 [Pseudalkalibacillus caeni]|uniref:Uncharacterized protein n=1 Tax=Exobacillus caeni TaxID=2574798 RepID=A0A5R9F0E8_9BACL|nr:hypothetical protein FCL54_14795 [Pseudalkalibacillus caeni]
MINEVNITESRDFQKAYNGFYRIRQRPKEFYETYYSFMEDNKDRSPSFRDTLQHKHNVHGRVEASFSSKLVATINPDLPVWETVVLDNLGLKPPAYYKKDKSERMRFYI